MTINRSHDELLAVILMAGTVTRSDKGPPTPQDLAHWGDDVKKAAIIVDAGNYGDQR